MSSFLRHRNSLVAALDPAWLMEAAGMRADRWQRDLLFSRERRLLVCCSRQAGKSTVVAALALHTALFQPGALVLILAPGLRQAKELHEKLGRMYGAVQEGLGDWAAARRMGALESEYVNGSRVVALPGNEERIRGFSGPALVILDEAARVPDALYASVRPMLAVSGGKLVAMSTPYGRRGWFWREWETGVGWERFRVPWHLCPRIDPAFIAEEKEALGQAWVDQEYGCSFGAGEGLVYPDFGACVEEAPAGLTGDKVGGIDYGWRNPFAAVWGVRTREDILWILGERYASRVSLEDHARGLGKEIKWFADPSGPLETEELRVAGFRVWPGPNPVRPGIAAVHGRLEGGRLKVARGACPNLIREAALYRYDNGKEGDPENPRDRDNHALDALRYLVGGLDRGRVARPRAGILNGLG